MSLTAADPIELVLAKLEGVKSVGSRKWSAKCPSHDDRQASLSVTSGRDGRTLLRCHAGCDTESICAAIGMKLANLFAPKAGDNGKATVVERYLYHDAEVAPIARKCRTSPKGFFWQSPRGNEWTNGRNGAAIPLYNLPKLINAREDDDEQWVLLVEGEKDADRATKAGFIATTSPDGASKDAQKPKWRSEFNDQLAGLRVAIMCDNDAAGLAHGTNAANQLLSKAREVRLIRVIPGVPEHGDLSDYLDAGHTADQLRELIEAAPEWAPTTCSDETATPSDGICPLSLGEIWKADPQLREPIIDGLLRRGEVGNIISTSKAYKTYLILGLAMSIITRRHWLDRFPCIGGRVLVIDLELQRASITQRTQHIAQAMHAPLDEVADAIHVIPMRGRTCSIDEIERQVLAMAPRTYSTIIVDPLYKTYPDPFDENSNAQMTHLIRQLCGRPRTWMGRW